MAGRSWPLPVAPRKVEAEPQESRRFTVEADDAEPLRFVAPSRRQAELWATALEAPGHEGEAGERGDRWGDRSAVRQLG